MEPLVYIILLNYNGANDTIECINSIENIKYKNYKIIIVDNNSTDNSLEILMKYIGNKHKIISSNKNNGFSFGNNIGIKEAINQGADYVLLLNNDTLVEKDFLNHLVSSIKENVGIAIGKIYYEKDRKRLWYDGGSINKKIGKVIHYNYNCIDKNYNYSEKKVSFATGCCMLIPISIFSSVGLLDESYFLYYEDADYSSKVSAAGYDIVYNPKSIIYHKVSATTGKKSSLTQYYMARNALLFINNNINKKYKVFSIIYFYIKSIWLLLKGEISFKSYFNGVKDYYKNIAYK
ncbi:TPA: glycosyltransferase family 2 protein [Clostridium perfringens]